jgi:putative hydrolase of the HAD superfamily
LNRFAGWMAERFPDIDQQKFLAVQHDLDVKTIEKAGYGRDRFPSSLVETYRWFCRHTGRQSDPLEESTCMAIGLSVYQHKVEVYDGVFETLEQLKVDGHRLSVYTAGDYRIQRKKLLDSGLLPYFEHEFISKHKNSQVLWQILGKLAEERENVWMIGNSLRSDIRPAMEVGIHALHIPAKKEWSYNQVELTVKPRMKCMFLRLNDIEEVPFAVKRHIDTQSVG